MNTMQGYKKCIVHLDGTSSKIKNKDVILQNIRYALSTLHIPMELHESNTDGFMSLKEAMNQEDTLYIINDSAPYHLCDKPNILITRHPNWVQAIPKPNTIGVFIHEILSSFPSELISCIARNTPVRAPHDYKSPRTYILANEYIPKDTETLARNGFAAFTWQGVLTNDIHTEVVLHQSEGWPYINQMLKEGVELFNHPDDILILINRDICLIPESTAIIRNYMDTHNYSECFAQRIDFNTGGMLTYADLEGKITYPGIDLFAFRAESIVMKSLLDIDFKLGRVAYDSFWAYRIKNKIPYNICYHLPHNSEWSTKDSGKEGNHFNICQIEKHSTETDLSPELYEKYFVGLI